jgi:hypothetical protein
MPLPHPPGYCRPHQSKVDHRRVVLAGLQMALFAALLVWLGHRTARSPGTVRTTLRKEPLLMVVLGAGFSGVWGETMRHLSLVACSQGLDTDRPPSGDNSGRVHASSTADAR